MPEVGKIYTLGDLDYRYGAGALIVRIIEVVREALFDNEPWWEVQAMVKPPDTYGPGQERYLYVRAAALDTKKGEQSQSSARPS